MDKADKVGRTVERANDRAMREEKSLWKTLSGREREEREG